MKKNAIKKVVAVLLTIAIMFTLCSCGAGSKIVGVKWVDIYSGTTVEFAKDGSATYGNNAATWEKGKDTYSINFTSNITGNTIERYAQLVEEKDDTYLQLSKDGLSNGETTDFAELKLYPEEKAIEMKNEVAKSAGDTVSSDIMNVTVKKAGLGYYATSPRYDSYSGKISNISEAYEPSQEGGFFDSSKGHCLLCIDFVIENTDRSTLDTGDYIIDMTVIKDGVSGIVKGYDLNNEDGSYGLQLAYCGISEDGGKTFKKYTSSNYLISAGQSIEIKYVGVVSCEPEKLDGEFDIVFGLKNSKNDKDRFIYTIK